MDVDMLWQDLCARVEACSQDVATRELELLLRKGLRKELDQVVKDTRSSFCELREVREGMAQLRAVARQTQEDSFALRSETAKSLQGLKQQLDESAQLRMPAPHVWDPSCAGHQLLQQVDAALGMVHDLRSHRSVKWTSHAAGYY
eukprot:gb/GFBE01048295.1/.p1 GENE.gb/GFBE01048295.1/~~gb/GFBE01048295.1/.p1  ORF type:complete len:145 (+),score=26.29 gb/GFBE01048295.1/:1-435(+)